MENVNSVVKHTGHQIMKLNIVAEEDVNVLRSDNGGECTSNESTKFCADKESRTSSLFHTVHSKMVLLND